MAEYYDHYHRWEPLAEFHFHIDENEDMYDDNYVYCLCSRALIRDGVKTYYVEKEYASESDVEALPEQMQEQDDESHVHFSVDTSYKVKCEKDEGASCYCSASHTDNYCSTDEHDPAHNLVTIPNALQPSDSGADLTFQECHTEYTNHDILEKMDQDIPPNTLKSNENYFSETSWEKFWAVNGERLIWASWIKKYSDYINPSYLDDNNDLVIDDNRIPKQLSIEEIYKKSNDDQKFDDQDDGMRERKYSFDSKVNPYKRHTNPNAIEKHIKNNELAAHKDDSWVGRRRSCSEHIRMLSPRTITGTDSMTNVTKITLSSYDVDSSRVTSDSSPTDDYSVSSSSTDDPSNDQTTRIFNIQDNVDIPNEEVDGEQYWQFLWKQHFGEQYALHYANYIESHLRNNSEPSQISNENADYFNKIDKKKDSLSVTVKNNESSNNTDEKVKDLEFENSQVHSQEIKNVEEMQSQVKEMKIEENASKSKKRNKKTTSNRIIGSVGLLLQTLLKEEAKKSEVTDAEVTEAANNENSNDNNDKKETTRDDVDRKSNTQNVPQSISNTSNLSSGSYNDGEDDPPEEKTVNLKRSHELDEEEEIAEKIKSTFQIMGFSMDADNMPKGEIVYRKRNARLRPPRSRKFGAPRKTYFDDDGNPCNLDQVQDSQDEREMQTEGDSPRIQTDSKPQRSVKSIEVKLTPSYDVQNKTESDSEPKDITLEASSIPLPLDLDTSFSDIQDVDNDELKTNEETVSGNTTKRRRRPKRNKVDYEVVDVSDMPEELQDDPKMIKYWKKRHSIFHKFDEGIKLDCESWFSATPERVARHIARKCIYDTVLDAFCGAGGNTIQFAMVCKKVIAIDIDPAKIAMARHNAAVYGVEDRIEFHVGDFFELAPNLEADMVFLSPPWGGPGYSINYEYDIETMLEPKPASELMRVARAINTNVSLYLPRNTKSDQILALAREAGGSVEIEQSFLDRRFVAITAYFY